jgi:hypothetical protein
MTLYDFDDPINEIVELGTGLGSIAASHFQGRELGGIALNAIGTGLGAGAGLVLANDRPDMTRVGAGLGGGALGHLITNYLTGLFLETPRERELRIKGLEYAVQQAAQQQSNQPIN